MGRDKGVRTKGNVKPSSSSRAAQLLHSKSSVPLETFSGGPAYIPVSSFTNEEIGIPKELQRLFAKISKKDPVTKLKALNELNTSCQSHPDDMIQLLPFWSRHFNRLCVDTDRRVRESVQIAMKSLAICCGKELAPYLRSIMGWWWVSQSDSHALAATKAQEGFHIAFPTDEKKSKALIFCYEEVLKLISQYIFSSVKSKQTDEQDFMNQLVANCLTSFVAFIKQISSNPKHEKVVESLQNIIDNPRFWKFQKHKTSSVRAAFYHIIKGIYIHKPQLLSKHLQNTHKSVFYALNEKEGSCLKAIWEAAFVITANCPDWYDNLDLNVGFLPQVYGIIQSSFSGYASFVGKLFPQIFKTFPTMIKTKNVFDKILQLHLDAIENNKSTIRSSAETKALVASFIDCLQLMMTSSSDDVIIMCKNQMFSIFKSCLHDNSNNPYLLKHFFLRFSLFLNTSHEFNGIDEIWQELNYILGSLVDDLNIYGLNNKLESEFSRFIQFLKCFLVIENRESTNKNVRFSDKESSFKKYSEMNSKVFQFLTNFYNHLINNNIQQNLQLFICENLFIYFIQKQFFINIFPTEQNPVSFFLLNYFFPLLTKPATDGSNYQLDISKQVSFVYKSLCHYNCPETDFFQLIFSKTSSDFSLNLIKETLQSSNPSNWISQWIYTSSDKMVEFICDRKQQLIDDQQLWSLLELAFTPWQHKPDTCKLPIKSVVRLLDAVIPSYLLDIDALIRISSLFTNLLPLFSDQEDIGRLADFYVCLVINLINSLAPAHILDQILMKLIQLHQLHHYFLQHPTELNLFFQKSASSLQNLIVKDPGNSLIHNLSSSFKQILISFPSNFLHLFLKNFLPSSSYWESSEIRNNLSWSGWINTHDILKGLYVPQTNQIWTESPTRPTYIDVVRTFTNFCNFLISDQSMKDFSDPSLDALAMETLLASSIASTRVSLTYPYSQYKDDVIKNASRIGHGWLLIFKSLLNLCIRELEVTNQLLTLELNDVTTNVLLVFCYESEDQESLRNLLHHLLRLPTSGHQLFIASVIINKIDDVTTGDVTATDVPSADVADDDVTTDDVTATDDTSADVADDDVTTDDVTAADVPSADVADDDVTLDDVTATDDNSSDVANNGVVDVDDVINDEATTNDVTILTLLAVTQRLRNDSNDVIFDSSDVTLVIGCLALFEEVGRALETSHVTLNESQWDFILCLLVTWFSDLKSRFIGQSEDPLKQSHLCALLTRLCDVTTRFHRLLTSSTARDDPTLPAGLVSEWQEFYSPLAHQTLVHIYLYVITPLRHHATYVDEVMTSMASLLKDTERGSILGGCRDQYPEEQKIIKKLLPHLTARFTPMTSLLDRLIAYELTSVLVTSSTVIQPDEELVHLVELLASQIDLCNLPTFTSQPVNDVTIEEDDDVTLDEDDDFTFEKDNDVISDKNDDVICDKKDEAKHEDDDVIRDEDDDVIFPRDLLTNYFLVFDLLLKQLERISLEQRRHHIVKLDDVINHLFRCLLSCLPHDSDHLFQTSLRVSDVTTFHDHVTCVTYKQLLRSVPALVRSIFHNADRKTQTHVDWYTRSYVSPLLCREELRVVAREDQPDQMKIISRPQLREVLASYEISDAQFEISIKLPANYPLNPVDVETLKRSGIPLAQWRYWILQMTSLLHQENGSIVDALSLWKRKVDKRFADVEECMVCFSVVHSSGTRSLPTLACKTCHKKFHPQCLYKWFDSSNQSTCPLCRSVMFFR